MINKTAKCAYIADGPVCSYLETPSEKKPWWVIARDNGESWWVETSATFLTKFSSQRAEEVFEAFRDKGSTKTSCGKSVLPQYQDFVAWAHKQGAKGQGAVLDAQRALRGGVEVPVDLPGGKVCSVTLWKPLTNWAERGRLTQLLVECLKLAFSTWGWYPPALHLTAHDSKTVAGLAYRPGKAHNNDPRTISLSKMCVEVFTDDGFSHIILHELCHHYREETWPRARGVFDDAHDTRFCDELLRVAPGADSCTSVILSKVLSEDRAQALESDVDWSPGAGTMVFDIDSKRALRFVWIPKKRGQWKQQVRFVYDEALAELLERFGTRAAEVPVVPGKTYVQRGAFDATAQILSLPTRRGGLHLVQASTSSLLGFMAGLLEAYGENSMRLTAEALKKITSALAPTAAPSSSGPVWRMV